MIFFSILLHSFSFASAEEADWRLRTTYSARWSIPSASLSIYRGRSIYFIWSVAVQKLAILSAWWFHILRFGKEGTHEHLLLIFENLAGMNWSA
jgi:hypothetical protein